MWKIEIPAAKGFSLLRRMFLNNVSSFARKNVDFYVSEESLRFSKLMFCIFTDVKLQSLEFGKNLAFVSFFVGFYRTKSIQSVYQRFMN